MKNKNLLIILVFACIAVIFVSCNDAANIVKVDKKAYDSLKTAASKWEVVTQLAEELIARKTSAVDNENEIIDTTSADQYILNYKHASALPPRPSAGVDFDQESLAFMIKYMLDNKIPKVRAAFGIYSKTTALNKDGFGTVIFGLPKKVTREEWEKNPNETATYPFRFKRIQNDGDTTTGGIGYLNWGDVVP